MLRLRPDAQGDLLAEGVRIVKKVGGKGRRRKRFGGDAINLENARHVRRLEQCSHPAATPRTVRIQILDRLGGVARRVRCRGAEMTNAFVGDALHAGLLHPGGARLHVRREGVRIEEACVGGDVQQPAPQ